MLKKNIICSLFVCLLLTMITCDVIYVNTMEPANWYDASSFRNNTYERVLSNWENEYDIITSANYQITPEQMLDENNHLEYDDDLDYGLVLKPKSGEKLTLKVNLEAEGLYHLGLDYFYQSSFTKGPKIAVLINGSYLFNELSELELEVSWKTITRTINNRYNRYGDELLPLSEPILTWHKAYLEDPTSSYKEPYYLLFNKGENEVEITFLDDDITIGNLYLGSIEPVCSYQEYFDLTKGKVIKGDQHIIIEAERYQEKNDIEVKASYYKGVKMNPNNYKTTVLNMLDGQSMSRGGTKVSYEFTVNETGYYQLALKYKQNALNGLAVAKNIYLDGEIPFSEMQGYLFFSTNNWVNHFLGNEEPYYFFLTTGKHQLTIESTSTHVTKIIDDLYQVMDQINGLGLIIKSITGNSNNSQIDWNIIKYLPDLSKNLNNLANILDDAYDKINRFNPTSKRASEVSGLQIASSQLKRLAKSPNKVQNRLGELCDGGGSAYQLIGTAIGTLKAQPLDIDYFVFYGTNYSLTNPNGNIFSRLWYGLKSFLFSFFDRRYQTTYQEDDVLKIWVAQSSLYCNILQNMIDEKFTKETNIKVQLHILPSSQNIVLNNATGTNPDLVLAIDSWIPYTYALRGMLEDLRTYDGFDEISSKIYASNYTPLIYDTGVYGIPETQGMSLMFYRTDIFDYLGLNPPDTWHDVIKILPTLQSYQMNFYHPLGHESAYKGFGQTSSFFYMMGSEIYHPKGYITNLNQEKSIEAIQFMTNLFTIYNLPQQVGSFFEHFRSGSLPIGLASIDFYLQLKYASLELAGQWDVLPIPGHYNLTTNEVERFTTTYGKCSIMFKSSKKKLDAWKFLKWYHQTSVQTEYLYQIKMALGEKYLIVPANIDSLASSVWDDKIKTQIIEQAKWSRIPAIIPGSYIIEREISNIWNQVVIDKLNPRVAVNQSIAKINRELARKFEEFGYLKDNVEVKPYLVPTKDNIYQWIRGRDDE